MSHSAVCLTGHKFSEVPKAETVHQTSGQAAHPMGSAAAEWPGLPLQSCRAAFPVCAVGGNLVDGSFFPLGGFVRNRKEFVQDFPDLIILNSLIGCHIRILRQPVHIILCAEQAVPCFIQALMYIFRMPHGSGALGGCQRHVQSIIADHPYRCHADPDAAAAIMGVGKAEIRSYGITGDLLLRQLRQKPDLLAVPKRTGSFVANIPTDEAVRKFESIPVLHHLVTISHPTQHAVIAVPHVGLEALDDAASGIEHIFLPDIPIQSRKASSLLGASDTSTPRPCHGFSRTYIIVSTFAAIFKYLLSQNFTENALRSAAL